MLAMRSMERTIEKIRFVFMIGYFLFAFDYLCIVAAL